MKFERHRLVESDPKTWISQIDCDRETAVRMAIAVVEGILPEWREKRPTDTAPLRAVDAARSNPSPPTENLRKHVKALAKACTQARSRSLGYEHLIAEAARAVAHASAATDDSEALAAAAEALSKTEEHMLYRFSVKGMYGKESEIRQDMLDRALAALASRAPMAGESASGHGEC